MTQSPTHPPITTVLVDDHHLLRQGIISILSELRDVKVVGEAGDGIEGLRVIDRTKPDVAILDITMKGLSGIEMIPRIKSISPRTKIIMYTMHENSDFIQQAMQAGAKGFVLKLDPSTELETAIRQVHSGQNYLSSTASAKIIDCIITGKDPGSTDDSNNALTPREHEISNLIAQGFDTTKIGQVLFISPKTVRVHRANIMKKLSCETTSELIVRLRDQLNSQTGM
ncbi:MAG: response regulator transcription factor [Proteobacteria bacterium]|nr:response regulator transcription factor [Pseudomonadota bacterium]MBU1639752.1 response regulator transcription factor [Pseudomonadota bacterium]